jgi:hypothetical protein
MIIWLNGTFGAGKTTTTKELVKLVPKARVFDPEEVGFMLRHVPDLPEVGDFQDWRPWRGLVVETASQLLDYVGGVLVVPQTVLVEQYWMEIRSGLEKAGIPVHHFLLHTDRETLLQRIETDPVETGARQWRLDHIPDYHNALPWLSREAAVINTTETPPAQVAQGIAVSVGARTTGGW